MQTFNCNTSLLYMKIQSKNKYLGLFSFLISEEPVPGCRDIATVTARRGVINIASKYLNITYLLIPIYMQTRIQIRILKCKLSFHYTY